MPVQSLKRQMNAVIHLFPFPEDRRSKSQDGQLFQTDLASFFINIETKQTKCPSHRVLFPPSESSMPGRIELMNMARP